MYSYGPPHMAVQKQDDQLELTYNNYVRTQDVTLKTCRRRWMIGRSGERGSGISVLVARHDDDDEGFGFKTLLSTRITLDYFIIVRCFWNYISICSSYRKCFVFPKRIMPVGVCQAIPFMYLKTFMGGMY